MKENTAEIIAQFIQNATIGDGLYVSISLSILTRSPAGGCV